MNFYRTSLNFFILILLWSFFISSISLSQEIQIKEIFTIGTKENELFYSIKDICIADDSTFYVVDSKGFSVSKFNKDGSLIKRIGQRGQGPGEFSMEPFTLILIEDTLYVADGLGKIQLFNTKLEYLINLPGLLLSTFVVDSYTKRVISVTSSYEPKEVLTYLSFFNTKFEKTSSVIIDKPHEYLLLNRFQIAVDEHHIVLMFYHLNRIEIRDKNGHFSKMFSIEGLPNDVPVTDMSKQMKKLKLITTSHRQGLSFLPQKWIFNSQAVDNLGHIFVQGGHYSGKGQIYVLNYEGDLLTTFKLPEGSRLLEIDQHGFLYARAEYHTLLKKYKIEYAGF